jgi:tRNA pseudouridine13 synthase
LKHYDYSSLRRVNPSALNCSAQIRAQAEYFQVDEQLPFSPDGSGGHVWLKIQKKGINTDWLAGELAKFAGVPQVAIGFAGLKDRHAVTRQWFSVNLEGHQEPNWPDFETEHIQILEQTRHGKKLKRGVLSGNQFTLRLTDITGDTTEWIEALERVKHFGVPNYFGEQRFGHNGSNLQRAEHWFSTGKAPRKRNQKSIYLSAARSWLFNLVLSARISASNWNKPILGDVMLLSGTKASLFTVEEVDDDLLKRSDIMDIHTTGTLWGRGEPACQQACLAIETQAIADWNDWKQSLEKQGLSQERRSLRLFADNFSWHFLPDSQLELTFFLPAGCYATSVMRELAVITDAQHRNYPDRSSISSDNSIVVKENKL